MTEVVHLSSLLHSLAISDLLRRPEWLLEDRGLGRKDWRLFMAMSVLGREGEEKEAKGNGEITLENG